MRKIHACIPVQIAVFPSGSHFCVVDFPISALYVNALLANLNARHFLHRTDLQYSSNADDAGVSTFALRDITSSAGTGTTVKDAVRSQLLSIRARSRSRSCRALRSSCALAHRPPNARWTRQRRVLVYHPDGSLRLTLTAHSQAIRTI